MSQQMGACCGSGSLHDGTPTGTVGTLHGLPTYIAEPPAGTAPKGIVVIIPDAFGWELNNNRILADNYAARTGLRVLLPDFMDGHWLAHSTMQVLDTVMDDKAGFFARFTAGFKAFLNFAPFLYLTRFSVTGPRVYGFFKELRASTELRIGAAGFCWGAKWTFYLCSPGTAAKKYTSLAQGGLVDAGFCAHPSMLDFPGDIKAVTTPMSLANGTKDFQLNEENTKKTKEIWDAPEYQGKHEVIIYDGAKHGFAVRGNPKDVEETRMGKEAEDQAVAWFKKTLIV